MELPRAAVKPKTRGRVLANPMLTPYVGQQVHPAIFQMRFHSNSHRHSIGRVGFDGLLGPCIILVGEYDRLNSGQDVWLVLGTGTCDAYVVGEFDLLASRFDFDTGTLDVSGLYVATEKRQVGGDNESDVRGFLMPQLHRGHLVAEAAVPLVLEAMDIPGIVVDGVALAGVGWLFVERFEPDVPAVARDDQQ